MAVGLACAVAYPQSTSKLNGKRIYVSRQEAGHQGGYDGFRMMLDANKAKYGYVFEYSAQPLGEAQLNALFDRLYKANTPKNANTIDILIFCQGEGDRNVGGGQQTVPWAGAPDRMAKVNAHVKNGGGLISVHGAGGREVSWHNWTFGAMLMTDLFVDDYRASSLIQGNGGHFSAKTPATYTLDDETLPAKDSSTYFIRKLLTGAKAQGGFGQPLVTDQVKGEWYHYNAGKQFEDGTGTNISHPNNKWTPKKVRGDKGVPDSGIGPVKVIGIITKIQSGGTYIPPNGGRTSVWAREVSKGAFDAKATKTNGRYVLFNPGHDGEEWTQGGNWMGDFFMSTLRWVVKDELGCMDASKPQFNPAATIHDPDACPSVALKGGVETSSFGKVSQAASDLEIDVEAAGPHSVKVLSLDGKVAFARSGEGSQSYKVPGLVRGTYLVLAGANGETFRKTVTVR
jgi:hypothetical protein